ncbi:MAG: OsmC family protein [bacterium]|nr:OsmC family protein [bacterium]
MTEVRTKFIDGMRFISMTDSGHSIVTDAAKDKGGVDSGPRPMELLLVALATCTGMDVVYILRKMRLDPSGIEISVKGERKEEHPKVYNKVHITYVFQDKLPEPKIKEAIELSLNKYCPIAAPLKAVGELTYEYKIIH